MASLEELLYSKLKTDVELAGMLAAFAGSPAIFERQAPHDKDAGWTGAQHPRIDYVVDWSEDPERKNQGTAILNIWGRIGLDTSPEVIEARVKSILSGAVFRPVGEPLVILKWSRTEGFEGLVGERDELEVGLSLAFDLLAFPVQTTTEPDPVAGLNAWADAKWAELQVDPASWAPTDANPALYWRLAGLQAAEQHAGVSWLDATIYGHVLAPTPAGRLPWIKKITEGLATARYVALADGSYLFIQAVAADSQADHLRTGQVRVTARFGILIPKPPAEILNRAVVSGSVSGEVT